MIEWLSANPNRVTSVAARPLRERLAMTYRRLIAAASGLSVLALTGHLHAQGTAVPKPAVTVTTRAQVQAASLPPQGVQMTVSPSALAVTVTSAGVVSGSTQLTVSVTYNGITNVSTGACVNARFLFVGAGYNAAGSALSPSVVGAAMGVVAAPLGSLGAAKFPSPTNLSGACTFSGAASTFTYTPLTNVQYATVCSQHVGHTFTFPMKVAYGVYGPSAGDKMGIDPQSGAPTSGSGATIGNGSSASSVQVNCVQ
jgi:hypothetical protein